MKSVFCVFVLVFFSPIFVYAQNNKAEYPFGSRGRNDEIQGAFLWHSESAGIVVQRCGNVSLVGASRYGLNASVELSSHLAMDYWIPNIALKKVWHNDDFVVSSRHELSSATPGLQWARDHHHFKLVTNESVPFLLSTTNEILVSRPFIDKVSCNGKHPWLILTAAASISVGVPFESYEGRQMQFHFLANRGEAWSGRGWYGCLKARADWQMKQNMVLRGSLRYFAGSFPGHHAVEMDASVEYFPLPRLSLSGGVMTSMAGYQNLNFVGFMPFVDLTWYFGRYDAIQSGLFERDVVKSISRKKRR